MRYRSLRGDDRGGGELTVTWPILIASPADGGGNHTGSRVRKAGFMAIPRGHRFAIEFDRAFPQGLVLIGEVVPDNEYQTREDKAAGRYARRSTS
jgi:hypothetical protein